MAIRSSVMRLFKPPTLSGGTHGADIKGLVPENVRLALMEKYNKGEVRQATPCLSPPFGGFRVK